MLAQVNGLQVFYELDGNPDKPWLTMVTGITNDTTMWDGQIEALQNDFHILRYDLRGQGQSASTPSPYSIELLGAESFNGSWFRWVDLFVFRHSSAQPNYQVSALLLSSNHGGGFCCYVAPIISNRRGWWD